MKGKWQTDAVIHNNNTSHDGAVMRTITQVYPWQPQQYNSFCHFRESISVWSSFSLSQTYFFSPPKPLYRKPFIITRDSTSKHTMFSSLLVLLNPTCIVIPAQAMNNSDSSWGCDENKLTKCKEEWVKNTTPPAPHQTILVTFPSLGETVLHPNTH